MNTIVLLVTLFLLAVVMLSTLKGADFLEDPDPVETESLHRRRVLAEFRQISRHRPDHIVSTADSEAERKDNQ